jgi:type VI secretion system Hcp family effector
MKKIKLCTLVASLVLGGSLHAGLYVKFDNLKGSSMNESYKDWSEASSFSVNGSREFNVGRAPAGGPGAAAAAKANWAQFEIIKTQDRVTADLMALFCTGRAIRTVTITLTTLGGSEQELPIFEIKLDGVTICSQQLSGNGNGFYGPTETLSLGYQKITWRFTPINNQTGGLDTSNRTSGGWDILKGNAANYVQ